jgi:hypothetical protein
MTPYGLVPNFSYELPSKHPSTLTLSSRANYVRPTLFVNMSSVVGKFLNV